jgi:hypothetical protein
MMRAAMNPPNRTCPQCGKEIEPIANSCAGCGARTPFRLGAESGSFQENLNPPATIIEGLDATSGDQRIIVNSPAAKSETRLTDAVKCQLQ